MSESRNVIFPKGKKAAADYFTETAWVKMLILREPSFNTTVKNVVF